MLRHGELLDVRVAVQAYNRQAWQIFAEVAADSRDPGAVDEAKIIVWVGSEPLDQLGRRPFEGFRLRPQRRRAVRLSRQSMGKHRERPGKAKEVAEVIHADSFHARRCAGLVVTGRSAIPRWARWHYNNSAHNAVITRMPARFSQIPAFIICGIRTSPVPNTMAFGGVPTGIM